MSQPPFLDDISRRRALRYLSCLLRPYDLLFTQTNYETPVVQVFRFPKTWRVWAPARKYVAYLTAGMSDREMPWDGKEHRPRRVELLACANAVKLTAPEDRDLVAWALHTLAHTPWRENACFGPLDTVSWGGPPLIEGSEMTGFLFAISEWIDGEKLCKASGSAEMFLQVVPISEAERRFAQEQGSVALVDKFVENKVLPIFDLERESCL